MRVYWWFQALCILSTARATLEQEHSVTCHDLKTLYRDSENDGEKSCCKRDDDYRRTLVLPELERGEVLLLQRSKPIEWNLEPFGATELWDEDESNVRVVVPDVNKLYSFLVYGEGIDGVYNRPRFPIISLFVTSSRSNPEALVDDFASVTSIYKM
jgi:hypothetical protein